MVTRYRQHQLRDDRRQGDSNSVIWYSVVRDAADLETVESIGRKAGERSAARLGARKIDTCEVPVLFEAPIAAGLIGHFASAISGNNLYRKSSFLIDSIGQQVFTPDIQILELPHVHKGLASGPFDDDGVATLDRHVVENGIVQGYFLGSYSARKLGMRTTGNAGGTHNLIMKNSAPLPFNDLLKQMGTGLLVTELWGTALISDWRLFAGASGFWVKNGVVSHPVEEITIAGNLKDMFRGIVAIGDDIIVRGRNNAAR